MCAVTVAFSFRSHTNSKNKLKN